MAFTPADKYVTPTGIGLYDALFGEASKGGPNSGSHRGDVTTLFGDDPLLHTRRTWDAQRNGWGVLDPTDQLKWATQGSTNRFVGDGTIDPQSGLPNDGWADRWNQWFGEDVVGPDGVTLPSAYKMTGLRVGQDYGVNRDAQGNVADPWHSEMFQSALGIRNNLNQDAWLDPVTAQSGLRLIQQNTANAMPKTGDYLNTMRLAIGDPSEADFYGQRGLQQAGYFNKLTDFDQYGLRGIEQTNNLADTNLRQLSRGIDREAEETLAMQLPEISQAMEAAGLGRSGASQLQMLGAQKDIMSQANRDKQRVMADYTDREANRQAQAINLATQQGYGGMSQKFGALQDATSLGSQIGAQGYGNYANQMGQAGLAGLGDLFQANQANRQNEQGLFAQQMQNRFNKNQGDQNALFQMLGQAGQFGLGQLDAERMGQSQALADYMNLVNSREQWRGQSLNEMLNLSDRERSIEQDRLNQMMQAGFMPLDLMTRLTTGISGSNYQGANSTPWWAGALGGAANGVGQGVGEGVAGWMKDWMGNG